MAQLPIFYINLARRTDRRHFMEDQFVRLGITAERIEAATLAEVTQSDLRPFADPHHPWAITPSEVACRLSHQRAWELMLQRGLRSAVILEDDVVLGAAFPRIVESQEIDLFGADILRLECSNKRVRLGSIRATLAERFTARAMLSSDICAGAYIITAAMAQKSLSDSRLSALSIDGYLFMRRGGVVPNGALMQLDPAPCAQLHFLSSDANRVRVSDLTPARRSAPPRPKSFRARWRKATSDLSYSVRSIYMTIINHRGIAPRRQRIKCDLLP
ncbi:glycosyltransferase family 25 protein [Devosia sp.]|uniref:glycosyltransferase family 25 protein n=1 Tax=Devosia sp. TaxID=1871048 RepID=UPI003A9110DE